MMLKNFFRFNKYQFISNNHIDDTQHTMSSSINKFCFQKIPVDILVNLIKDGYTIDIIGIFPNHFEKYYFSLGYKDIIQIPFIYNKRMKKFNCIRPTFFIGKNFYNQKKIILSIPPGEDYIKHYIRIITYFLDIYFKNFKILTNIYRSNYHEKNIMEITNFNRKFIFTDESVILGYVDEIYENLKDKLQLISEYQNEYYISKRCRINNKNINFLGVKYSYWGNISQKIIERLLEYRVKEIVYSAKLGTLVSHLDIYSKIYSPSEYIIMEGLKTKTERFTLENKILKLFPFLDSQLHVSTPTILEQTYKQRELLSKMNVNSIDNEISQMAKIIYNKGSKTNFFALHFPTDYLRKDTEKDLCTNFDLSNNRESMAISKKNEIIKEISYYLYQYFMEENI